MRYFDIKTMIALSSILHISFIIILITIRKMVRNISILIIIAGHGIVSYYLFFIITIKYEMADNRRNIFNKSKESTRKTISLFLIIFIFINIGVPPLINFIREIITCISIIIKRTIILLITITYIIVFVRLTIIFSRSIRYRKKQNIEKGDFPSSTITKTTFLILSTLFLIRIY